MNHINLKENLSLDRWVWLLKRTVQDNSWSILHEGFNTDNSCFRELADTLDYINDEVNNVQPIKEVRQSIETTIGVLKVFREKFALDMFKKHTANAYDANLVISMFNRTVTFEENDKQLLNAIKDSFNKRKSDRYPLVNNLDQAFQLRRLEGKSNNPYEVPNNIRQLVAMIIDKNMSRAKAIIELDNIANNHLLKTKDNKGLWRTANSQPRPQIWSEGRWRDEMDNYKWAALNDYLYERMEGGRITLNDSEIKRIKNNWNNIDMPNQLIIYPTYLKLEIGMVKAKARVIKANKNLH